MTDAERAQLAVMADRQQNFEGHCRNQHRALESKLSDIHHTLFGNGREGIIERMRGHADAIAAIRSNLDSARRDIHEVKEKVGGLNIQFWKMAAVIAAIAGSTSAGVAGIIKALF